MADIGALLQGISGSLAQGRDYNLAVARARQSAGLRLRGIELQEREAELNELRFEQAREEGRIKTLAETEDLKALLRQSRRETKAEKTIAEYEEATTEPILSAVREIGAGRAVPGGPERRVRRLGRKAASAYETLGREVPARLEEQLQTPTQRRARRIKEEQTQATTAESRARARQIREGKDPDQISQARLLRDVRKDYNQYIQSLPITNILREQQGQSPLPELTFEEYALSIFGGESPEPKITVPGLLDGSVAPEDSLIFNPEPDLR